jgi:hypothetical protein
MISGSGSTLFEELGLYYIGPVDGHNLDTIISILQGARAIVILDAARLGRPPRLPACLRRRSAEGSARKRRHRAGCTVPQ